MLGMGPRLEPWIVTGAPPAMLKYLRPGVSMVSWYRMPLSVLNTASVSGSNASAH
jgi:hypothetical protein